MTVPPRQLLLAYDFPPMPGGIARAMGEIVRHGGGRVVACTGRLPGMDAFDRPLGDLVVRAPVAAGRLRTLPGLLRWAGCAQAVAREAGAGFVWAGNLKPAGYVARWLRARRRLPYGLIVYGQDLLRLEMQCRRSARRRWMARQLIGGAELTVAISGWTGARFRALAEGLRLPAAAARVRIVPLGADPERFRPQGPVADLGPGRWLLTVARLLPHKGIEDGIRALALLGTDHPDLRYVIAGEGPDRARLEQIACELGVANRVRLAGAVGEPELAALYRAAEVYLGLSREDGRDVEGFGLSLVEASASGRPVVATRSGGIEDAVTDGESGLLVPSRDATAAARAIAALLDDPALTRRLGAGGRSLVERRLNWNRVVDDLGAAAAASGAAG